MIAIITRAPTSMNTALIDLHDPVGEHRPEQGGVGGHPGQQVAGLEPVHLGDTQPEHPVHQAAPGGVDDALAHALQHVPAERADDTRLPRARSRSGRAAARSATAAPKASTTDLASSGIASPVSALPRVSPPPSSRAPLRPDVTQERTPGAVSAAHADAGAR